MEKLKPCPFCGSEGIVSHSRDIYGDIWDFIGCSKCFAGYRGMSEYERHLELWNTRSINPLIEEMAEALQQMADMYYGRDKQPIAGAYAKKMDAVLQKYHEQVGDTNAK